MVAEAVVEMLAVIKVVILVEVVMVEVISPPRLRWR